jgi:tRNA1Val (adenine37-N6)-methyltransferase
MGARTALVDPELGELSDDRLTANYRVFQRRDGHRFSVDDVATAYVAAHAQPQAICILDLGTGLGSVLLHLAQHFPYARLAGIEAQAQSFELLRRNVVRNQLESRVQIVHGDLRTDLESIRQPTHFDLITGTPPYFPPGTALDAHDAQRMMARIETRGGVEAYMDAARQRLAPGGVLVLCGAADAQPRILRTQRELHLVRTTRIVPKQGKQALFCIWELRIEPCEPQYSELVIRNAKGDLLADALALRAFSGFGPPGTNSRD